MPSGKEKKYFINQPWLEQLCGYCQQWLDNHDQFAYPELVFLMDVNKSLARDGSKETLEPEAWEAILAGGAVSSDIRTALSRVLDIYGDIGANFQDAYREHSKLLEKQVADAELQRVAGFRAFNPDGKKEAQSFAEMIEAAYRETLAKPGQKISMGDFIHQRVLPEWGAYGKPMNAYVFCDMLKARDAHVRGGGFMVPATLSKWKTTPDAQIKLPTMAAFVKAFRLDEAHELMLWKVINGKPFRNPYPGAVAKGDAVAELQTAVSNCVTAKSHGKLVGALLDASGIPRDRLQEVVGSSGMYHWEHSDSVIDTVKVADKYMDTVLAPFNAVDTKKTAVIRQQLLPVLTGRLFDVDSLVKEAKRDGVDNPGGELFKLLTGKRGAIYLSDDDMIAAFAEKKVTVSHAKMDGMRSNTRGKHDNIYENVADTIITIVEEKAGICFTDEQREECTEILTGFPSAAQMIAQLREGKITPGKLAQKICLRRNIDFEKMASDTGCSCTTMTKFMHDTEFLGHEFARNVSAAIGYKGEDKRAFVVAATGHDVSLPPGALLGQAVGKSTPQQRVPELRKIYDWSAMTRQELADASGITLSTLNRGILADTGGTISAPPDNLRALAMLCGFDHQQTKQFVSTYASPWVGSTASKSSRGASVA